MSGEDAMTYLEGSWAILFGTMFDIAYAGELPPQPRRTNGILLEFFNRTTPTIQKCLDTLLAQ